MTPPGTAISFARILLRAYRSHETNVAPSGVVIYFSGRSEYSAKLWLVQNGI